jgi:hypothetical protein
MSLGHQLERAERLATTSTGKRVRPVDRKQIGYSVMPVRETPPHALSRGVDNELADAQIVALRKAAFERVLATKLSPIQRAVYELQQRTSWDERYVTISTAEKVELAGDADTIAASRASKGDAWVVKRRFEKRMTQQQIADELGISVRQVRTAIETTHRILRACSLEV